MQMSKSSEPLTLSLDCVCTQTTAFPPLSSEPRKVCFSMRVTYIMVALFSKSAPVFFHPEGAEVAGIGAQWTPRFPITAGDGKVLVLSNAPGDLFFPRVKNLVIYGITCQ